MTPLVVTGTLGGAVALPGGPLALDSLLASQVALREQLPPPRDASECVPIAIPVQLEPGGRFHLASFSVSGYDAHALRYLNRRAPIEQYQALGTTKIRRVLIAGGVNKSYRIPMETKHAEGDALTWYCVGDAEQIRDLLSTVVYLGKRRAVGMGKVVSWDVSPCEPWGAGFPVVSPEGLPLRTLPQDWPGLMNPPLEYRTLTYPYYDHAREELCACPQ